MKPAAIAGAFFEDFPVLLAPTDGAWVEWRLAAQQQERAQAQPGAGDGK
ncbi:MAG TPA: hypothetical protein VGI32_01415 [Steroidobacteraceae bacterium]|jgi:hypothetical protein